MYYYTVYTLLSCFTFFLCCCLYYRPTGLLVYCNISKSILLTPSEADRNPSVKSQCSYISQCNNPSVHKQLHIRIWDLAPLAYPDALCFVVKYRKSSIRYTILSRYQIRPWYDVNVGPCKIFTVAHLYVYNVCGHLLVLGRQSSGPSIRIAKGRKLYVLDSSYNLPAMI